MPCPLFRPVSRNLVANELEWVFLVLLDYVEKLFGPVELLSALFGRGKFNLHQKPGQILVFYLSHILFAAGKNIRCYYLRFYHSAHKKAAP